jgi:hypothetical protein
MALTLEELTGERSGGAGGAWNEWMIWLGENAERYRPPAGYPEWKATLLSLIDQRMADFFAPAPGSEQIDLVEVVWGGMPTDGIPDLDHAPTVAAEEATYLGREERVFGVSINGEHRAYPLRIVNAHEMANDTLGGEPIALAY